MESKDPAMPIARRLLRAGWVKDGDIVEVENYGKARFELTQEGADQMMILGLILRALEGDTPMSGGELEYLKAASYHYLPKNP